MADKPDNIGGARWPGRAIAGWTSVAALILLPLAAGEDGNIACTRNQLVMAAAGERVWLGTFWNHTDSLYTDLDAVILFLDQEDKPVDRASRGGWAGAIV